MSDVRSPGDGQILERLAADEALAIVRDPPTDRDATIIDEVSDEPPTRVLGRTGFGGHRMIDMPVGDPLPRIS